MRMYTLSSTAEYLSYDGDDPFRAAICYAETEAHVLELLHEHLMAEFEEYLDPSDLPVVALSEEQTTTETNEPYWTLSDACVSPSDEPFHTWEFHVMVELENVDHLPGLVILL